MSSGTPLQVVPNVSQKTCKKCQVEKPAEEFPRNKLTSDGLHSYCKYVILPIMCFLKRFERHCPTPIMKSDVSVF